MDRDAFRGHRHFRARLLALIGAAAHPPYDHLTIHYQINYAGTARAEASRPGTSDLTWMLILCIIKVQKGSNIGVTLLFFFEGP